MQKVLEANNDPLKEPSISMSEDSDRKPDPISIVDEIERKNTQKGKPQGPRPTKLFDDSFYQEKLEKINDVV